MNSFVSAGFFGTLIIMLFAYMKISRRLKRKMVAAHISNGAMIVDVRTPGEFGGGHYNGAINIPLDKISKNISKMGSKDRSVIVYCASGARSSSAAGILKKSGFNNVCNAGSIANMPK